MDKTSKYTYNYLKKYGYRRITKYTLPEPVSIPWSDFVNSLLYLERCGYVRCIHHSIEGVIGGQLTHEGKHKFEIDMENAFRSFFTRYIPGFVSGVAVTVTADLLVRHGHSILSALFQLLQFH